ncbi:NADPH-dependent FMN reductase [Microbacterium sulfonylureivorans]|uniref:NADPH-dependent FMN reductase n=1 Tax=Microbacterium sulfonylureivorans TaxID=2486854 RepID=UPI000FDC0609|nr:NADPH-dependent FMN reductase [Microbacterium sulfonylureivorans]
MPPSKDSYSVAVIVGSVSQPSLNRRLAGALAVLAPEAGLELTDVPIDDLPFFGAHMESKEDYPQVGRAFKRAVDDADGLLIVTPEYNRSIPGVLKNAIDWASRPDGESSFPGRPTAVIGASGGEISTAVAQNHLKAILTSQGAVVLGEPEAYIHCEDGLIDDQGRVTDASTRTFLAGFLASFRDLIERF